MKIASWSVDTVNNGGAPRVPSSKALLISSLTLWVVSVAVGMWFLWNYEKTPGQQSQPPRQWPSHSSIERSPGGFTLVMAVHPRCPCSRASLEELATLMAHCGRRLRVNLLFVKPDRLTEGWEQTDLWTKAQGIPGVIPIVDPNGVEAGRFHAHTSGQTALYDESGRLVFGGGITPSRGHVGANAGRDSIISLVNSRTTDQSETLVFGCPLFDSDSACRTQTNE